MCVRTLEGSNPINKIQKIVDSACHKISNYLNLRLIRRFPGCKDSLDEVGIRQPRAFFARSEPRSSRHNFGLGNCAYIKLDAKSRDDIPALLRGLQHIYRERKDSRSSRCAHICPGVDRSFGRPGMDMWKILVLGISGSGLRSPSRTCESAQDGSPGTWRFCGRCLLPDGY